ncbi:hypothetical protein ACFQ0G_01110 [Streptomyces chiangmaiensis]
MGTCSYETPSTGRAWSGVNHTRYSRGSTPSVTASLAHMGKPTQYIQPPSCH